MYPVLRGGEGVLGSKGLFLLPLKLHRIGCWLLYHRPRSYEVHMYKTNGFSVFKFLDFEKEKLFESLFKPYQNKVSNSILY